MLSLSFHHVLLDGYSMCQVAQLILDALAGIPLSVTKLGECKSGMLDEAKERNFWLDYFEGLQAEERIFPENVQGLERTRYRFLLGKELTAEIDAFAKRWGITGPSVFAGALGLYLARATDCPDAVFLMPRLNRPTEEERSSGGCYTLVVPVRIRPLAGMSFVELCSNALSQGQRASSHKEYGMGNIISDLKAAGIINGSISEYTLNIYQPELKTEVPYEIFLNMDGAMHNHLTLNITRIKGIYEICYDARNGVYDAGRVEWFHEAFLHILREGIQKGYVPIEEISIVSEAEEHRLLYDMCGKTVAIPEDATIPSLFRSAVMRFAERPALYAGEKSYTFAELDCVSNRVAHGLLACGVKTGEPVLYMLRRDYRLIPAMLGISKAGAAFIPVDPQYPRERVDYILENSGANYLISSKDVEKAREYAFLEVDELLKTEADYDPEMIIPSDQPAYCIYTSGTTGRPKGVMLSHKGIANITHPDNNPFNRDVCKTGKGLVAIGSVCFDISLFEFFVPLFNGMFLEFAPESALADPAALAGLLAAHGANLLHCTPSRLAAYLGEPRFSEQLAHVEAILTAGEVLPKSLVDELKGSYGIRIYNGYGPTETTIGAAITEAGDDRSIGKPIANMGILILDKAGRLLPFGAIGEICVYGRGVGLGYRNLPEETEKRFVELYGRRMYRTGDLGCFLADGRICYHGRNDHQVKIRGLRIELPEIENCILSFPGIGSAAVQVRVISGSQHLVGFYTVKDKEYVTEDALKAYLKGRLTFYMVPDILKRLTAMPQTPGGKTDLKALEKESVEYVRTYRAPENAFQRAVCDAFAAVLGEEQIGLYDHFFELGGDSLHTAELVNEIGKRLSEVQISYENIFQYPTPELLAQYLYRPAAKEEKNPLAELDYEGMEEFLENNRPGEARVHPLGTILLTGVTGFLGLHILLELLAVPDQWEHIYCLVRPTRRQDGNQRLRSTLFYYGEHDYEELFGQRLTALEGDLEEPAIFAEEFSGKVDTVIHCAANVAHFSFDDKLERVNVGGVQNILAFCKEQGASYVHVSTISVAGAYPREVQPLVLSEQKLFVGQEIHNQYIRSKYMAEYMIVRAAIRDGIPVKLMRVGNLQGRLADGEFQMNHSRNAFTRQIASYVKIGKVPVSLYEGTVNFSPVDETARMIVTLAGLEGNYSVFHVYPPQEVAYQKLFGTLAQIGHRVEVVTDEEFEKEIDRLRRTKHGRQLLEGILLERPNLRFINTVVTQAFTQEMIERLGLCWSAVTDDYLKKYFEALENFLLFDDVEL